MQKQAEGNNPDFLTGLNFYSLSVIYVRKCGSGAGLQGSDRKNDGSIKIKIALNTG